MSQRTELALPELYAEDETAWLDAMADLLAAGAYAELDYASLREYLTDAAQRDRREVESRLVILLAHVFKWVHQPDHRSGSVVDVITPERRYEHGRVEETLHRPSSSSRSPRTWSMSSGREVSAGAPPDR